MKLVTRYFVKQIDENIVNLINYPQDSTTTGSTKGVWQTQHIRLELQ